ncbi:hypothetical protein ANO14919_070310 [Xylariales sp. No.14919]|nr:hypothetical protein ANO14919_070310 [Xylariales sp. No.14919]
MTYSITGIQAGITDTIPIRRDVDEWYCGQIGAHSNRIQLTLFVEALNAIQRLPLSDEKSYFRLAGIHAAPWTEWDGVGPKENDGFCVHNDYTFPTWHRVYVTLFEQVLYEAMIQFITGSLGVPEGVKQEWRKEAEQWRLPYWDFARFSRTECDGTGEQSQSAEGRELRLPVLAMIPQVKVRKIGSDPPELEYRPNPLYKFQMTMPMGQLEDPFKITSQRTDGIPFDQCMATTKYGLLEGHHADVLADGGQHWSRVNIALNEHPWCGSIAASSASNPTLQELTYRLLTSRSHSWGDFSSTRSNETGDQSKPEKWLNLEGIHNNIHNWVGGFFYKRPDPKDWKLWGSGHMAHVHVAAFDPIFWLHHCNIDRLTAIWQRLNPQKWFEDEESKLTLKKELIPFHKDDGTLYTSGDLQDWRKLGYEYEITKGEDVDNNTWIDVHKLYGKTMQKLYEDESIDKDYILVVRYDRYALRGKPFLINIFLGDVDREDFYDAGSPHFVGSIYSFSSPLDDSRCSNCIEQQKNGVLSVSLLPATLVVKNRDVDVKKLFYVAIDSQGKSVNGEVQVKVTLFKAPRPYYDAPGDGGNDYENIADGAPAQVDY